MSEAKKRGTGLYLALIIGLVLMCAFFFTSPFWAGDDRPNRQKNFGIIFTLANAWQIKMDSAVYDPERRILEIKYYAKTEDEEATAPKMTITLADDTQNLSAVFTQAEDSDYGNYIQISDVPPDWYYLCFTLRALPAPDPIPQPTTDIFGVVQEVNIPPTVEDVQQVQIDYRNVATGSIVVKDAAWQEEWQGRRDTLYYLNLDVTNALNELTKLENEKVLGVVEDYDTEHSKATQTLEAAQTALEDFKKENGMS